MTMICEARGRPGRGAARPATRRWCHAGPPLWVTLIGLCGVTACSLYLDWDREGLRCDKEAAVLGTAPCEDRYTCLGVECIKDGSVGPNETCSQDRQCRDYPTSICAPSLFVCRRACRDIYARGVCDTGSYCRPGDEGPPSVGVCEESSGCQNGDECGLTGEICIELSGAASDCFTPCQITWTSPEAPSHNCASEVDRPLQCQPLGSTVVQLACVPAGTDALQQDGDPCTPVISPCAPTSACVNGVCRAYCKLDSPACTPPLDCCPLADADTGICKPEC